MSPDEVVAGIVAAFHLEEGEVRLEPSTLARLVATVRGVADREAVAARLIALATRMKETPGTAYAVEELTTLAGLALGADDPTA